MAAIPEPLVSFVQALVDDESLRDWFESLADVSGRERAIEFTGVATRMRESGEHPELAHAVALLAAPGMFEAVLATLRELLEGAE